jgi:beta-mannosidase
MNTNDLEIDLSGNHWKMEKTRPGNGVREGFPLLPSEYQGTCFNWNQASVPGDVYTDLERAGEIDNIHMGRNMSRAKWAHEYEYWYVTKFNATEAMRDRRVRVVFEGVDYSCDVWLNGVLLGRHEGMFSNFSFDIMEVLRFEQWVEGCNILMIKLDPPPRNYRRVGGGKPCFAGDYMPGLVPCGIWRPVKVRTTGEVSIEANRIESTIREENAVVDMQLILENRSDHPVEVQVGAVVSGETCNTEEIQAASAHVLVPGTNPVRLEVPVAQARLWWPWDMGEQNLYRAVVSVEANGVVEDVRQDRFGIREIRMERNPGFTEDEVEFPWTFVVNGRRHFLRSACWGGPPSCFYGRNTKEKYRDRLEMVREANINNLRIFGWHPPEVPEFYELCDRLGITVWTNFCFATQAFEATPGFMASALGECRSIVQQRRNHPSNIFWMGGEEVFFSHAHVASDNKQIMEAIGEVVAEETNVPYAPASPLSGEYGQMLGYRPKDSTHANGHYYGAGHRLMEDFYTTLDYCVIPELTAASAPDVDSLRKFIPEGELWPMGPSWGYHWADITILKLLNVEVFGNPRTGSLDEFVEATQTAHGIIAQYALEHFRRRKPRVSAVALCHFLTYLPDIKWGIIDYYGKKKTCFDYVRRAYQPVLASLEYAKRRFRNGEVLDASIWIVNDHHRAYDDFALTWTVRDPDGGVIDTGTRTVSVGPDSSAAFHRLDCTVRGRDGAFFTVELDLVDAEGGVLSRNVHTLTVGDQDEARTRCLKLYGELNEEKRDLGKGYYRYHPELWDLD